VSGVNDSALDVLVIGAGISGLSAAYDLQRRGMSVRVLEASGRAGGVISTERFDGWVVEGGPDSLLVQKPAAVALCRELGLEDRLVSTLTPRTAYVLRDGELHAIHEGSFLGFPITASALLRSSLFSAAGKLRMACEAIVPRRGGDDDESIAAFVRRRFGAEAADYLAEPLLAGIHAGDAEQLSMRALFPRLLDAERTAGSVMRGFRALRVRPAPQGAFVSPRGGLGELVEALVATLPAGTLVLDARVNEVHRASTPPARASDTGRAGSTRTFRAPGYLVHSTGGTFTSRVVILAVPSYTAAALLRGFDTTLAALCDSIPYASTATVAFGYRRDQIAHPMQGSGFVVPRVERSPLLAGTWVTSKWPSRAPDGYALLRAFLGGGRDPHRLERSDDELVESAREEMATLLGITGAPLFSRLHRWTRQSPQYVVGHLQRIATIEQRLASIPGLFVTGSGFRAIGIPDCVADGRAAAARAAAHLAQE
jgi:oxygen-dependent protoporphyrinogen oxidase